MPSKKTPNTKLGFGLVLTLCVPIILFVWLAFPLLARAQDAGRMTFIRDAEIEHYLRELGKPIFKAASLDPKVIDLLIIQNRDINAFVAGGMNIFFYTGLLQATETPDQLQAVLAHETGHIAGGHLIRGTKAMSYASAEAIIGMLVALAAGVASGNGNVAIGAISGAQQIAEHNLLSFSRSQESSADAAAMRFLDGAHLSTQGLLEFMNKLSGQELMPIDRRSEYVRTHPLSQDRVQTIAHHVEITSALGRQTLPTSFKTNHSRMKAKLLGYLQPETALLRYTDKDPRPEARYARAIALYRKSQFDRAIAVCDSLLSDEPENPFYVELKAQILFENGHIQQAADLYRQAVTLLGSSALLRVAYAHALLESGSNHIHDEAIKQLLEANRLEKRNPESWRLLAAAWNLKGEETKNSIYQGFAAYALAEEAVTKGEYKLAEGYANRAIRILKKGSPYWLRAQDIKLSVNENSKD